MAAAGYPVPPGFTITTELCRIYQEQPEAVIDAVMADIDEHLQFIHDQFGYMPLLSVRSGAAISMPGMMDTILNVGMNDNEMKNWVSRIGERAAWDSWRRLLQMMGTTCFGLNGEFEEAMTAARADQGVETDAELDVKHLKMVFDKFRAIYSKAGIATPLTLKDQLRVCIDTVFKSWMGERAIEYRKIENIPDDLGTAVTVQAMVFGNMNDQSGSGVLFTRDPSTGEKKIFAEYLPNAQGEDVVAGIRTPEHLELAAHEDVGTPEDWRDELALLAVQLEDDYKDMVDAEFTVQNDELFILQSRVGKRSAQAAFKIALDLHKEGVITEDEMLGRVKRKHLVAVRRQGLDPKFKGKPMLTGLGASQGIATGQVWKTSKMAASMAATGKKVILVTHETTPDDIAGMAAAAGILTQTGGATSHAAVVARGMDKPCVVGCTALDMNDLPEGTVISIDGATGRVWKGEVPVVGGQLTEAAVTLINKLLAKNGVFPQSEHPSENGTVVLANWVALTDTEIGKRLGELVAASKVATVLIDITPPEQFGIEEDTLVWNIAGHVPETEQFIEKVLSKVVHSDIERENCRVCGGTPDLRGLFELKEFDVLPQVSTISEMLKVSGLCGITPELAKALSPDGGVQHTVDMLKKNGLFEGQVVTGSLPPAYAALQLLGE
jgi:pyruvate,orthophosphate dikinase